MDSAKSELSQTLMGNKEEMVQRLQDLCLPLDRQQEIVNFLINSQDMDKTDKEAAGYEQLEKAVCQGNDKLIEFLLDCGVDINVRGKYGVRTVLFKTLDDICNPRILKLLLDRGADPNVVEDWYGFTPLEVAAADMGRREEIELLVKYGANFEVADKMLFIAAERNDIEMIKYLLNCEVNVNAQNECGCTALHLALDDVDEDTNYDDFNDIVELLLHNGADLNVTNVGNHTPLECAVDLWKQEEATILVKEIAKLKSIGSYVSDNNIACIERNKYLSRLLEDCESEIRDLKCRQIQGTTISYFKILNTSKVQELAKLAANEVILEAINSDHLKQEFLFYGTTLKRCLARGVERKNLLDRLESIFQCLGNAGGKVPFTTVNSADKIYSYLSNTDLKNLAIAFHVESNVKSCDYLYRAKSKNLYLMSVLFVLLGCLFCNVLILLLEPYN